MILDIREKFKMSAMKENKRNDVVCMTTTIQRREGNGTHMDVKFPHFTCSSEILTLRRQ